MKRLFGISFLLFSVFMLNAEVIEKTWNIEAPMVSNSDGFHIVKFSNSMLTGKAGEPSLPYIAVKFLLPAGESAQSIEFIGEEETLLSGTFKLFPYQPSRPLSEGKSGQFMMNEQIYSSMQNYPENPKGELVTHYLNGYAIAMSTFTPIKYNPATGVVSYYKKVKIRIKSGPDSKSTASLQNLTFDTERRLRVEQFVQNPEVISSYPKQSKVSGYQMMIITPSQFETNFQSLIDIYLERGIIAQVATNEMIVSTMSGLDSQEKIRNYIIQEYQNNGVEYILLGGDIEHVPYRGLYCYVQSGSGYTDDDIPADLYYSALDGNWNTDGDDLWGEPGEDDLLPDIAVARFPFSDATELSNMIQKTISYQNNPVLGELRDASLAGEWLYSSPDTYGSDYLELLIGYQNENGYETWGIPDDYNFSKLYTEVQSWGAADLRAEINAGRQYVHHVGHANTTFVAYMYNSDITDANFSGANGVDHNYTIFHSHGCICGAFDASDCIMERMIAIENFAAVIIGNSRYGWFNEGQTEGPAAHLHREMVDAMYHEKINHVGAAFVESKIQTAPWVTAPGQHEEGALRWNFYDINILGDPVLSVWTDEPITLSVNYQNNIPIGTTSTSVTVSSGGLSMENFTCTLIKDDIIYGVGITDASGNTTIAIDPVFTEVGSAELIVVGYNSLPTSYPISIIPNAGAHVIYATHTVDDSQGNNNGQVDFDETIGLTIEIENVGLVQGDNIVASLSTTDSYIMVTDNSENYGSIAGGGSQSVTNGFAFEVADNIPDQHIVTFELEVTDGTDTWNSSFQIIVNAPQLEFGALSIDDNTGGNGNGRLDPGETADITIPVLNNGNSNSPLASALLSSASTWITINTGSASFGVINAGTGSDAVFNITCDPLTPVGTPVDLMVDVGAGNYGINNTFYTPVGLVLEDWETGNFASYPWSFAGTADWTITDVDPYEGIYCAKSGVITHSQTTELLVDVYVSAADDISFYCKVSSESNYDYLRFYIDGVQQEQWSGEVAWGQVSYPVTTGAHTFKWEYMKDGSVSTGSDCGWVDYIIFPPIVPPPDPAEIALSPLSFEVTLAPDGSTVEQLNIANIGEEDLSFTLLKSYLSDADGSKAYCTSVGGGGDEFIQNVTIGIINNTTAQSNYADYTNISTAVNVGETYPITITNGDPNWSTDQCGIWVDWNQNEDFTDDGMITVSGTPGVGPYTANIVPPVDALGGPTRMRVQILYSATPDPCLASFSYGEVEDYSLIVNSNFSDWLTLDPTSGTVAGSDNMDIDLTFDATGMEMGDYFANVIINSSDPVNPQMIVPCTLHVAAGVLVNVKAILEGPFVGTEMTSNLNALGMIPNNQPYNTAPWNYEGTESVTSIPNADIADWVLVELRETPGDVTTATPATMISQKAGFVLKDGSIVSTDGLSLINFDVTVSQNLFTVVHHRNHLGIISATPVTMVDGSYVYDFTTGMDKVYGGNLAHKQIAPGVWAMFSGDGLCDGEVDNKDKNDIWEVQNNTNGYFSGDMNLDGFVDMMDNSMFWKYNSGKCSHVIK